MNIIYIILLVILGLIILEAVKHLFVRKFSKTIFIIFIIFLILITISYFVADSPVFEDNKFVQTGAVIAENVKENIPTEGITSSLDTNNFFET